MPGLTGSPPRVKLAKRRAMLNAAQLRRARELVRRLERLTGDEADTATRKVLVVYGRNEAVKEKVAKAEAADMKKKLEEVGATVEVK